MRFRVWHFLAAMAFVALWLPLTKWLLALEGKDHPLKPQTAADFIGFYLGSMLFASLPLAAAWKVVAAFRNRKRRDSAFTNFMSSTRQGQAPPPAGGSGGRLLP